MSLVLTLGTIYVASCQNVSAVEDEIVSDTIEINSNTTNGPDLSNEDGFGSSIANIGDLNGDGTSDIAVGAIGDDAGGTDRGAIHVLFMNHNGTVSHTIEINDTTANGPDLNNVDQFGTSIASMGDLNNDGIFDIAASGALGGTVHIMVMNHNGTVSRTIEINDNTANGPDLNNTDYFGSSIANIGDLNGDGISDIAVGAIGDNAGGTDRGAMHIMFMNGNGTVSRTIEINDNTANGPDLNNTDYFGSSIANIGDLNGDGISDIAVGAIGDNAGGTDRGAMHIMFMNGNGTVSRTIEINDNTANGPDLNNVDQFGTSIASMGDLNGDGVLDIAVGAIGDDAGGTDRGAMHIMFMNGNGTVSRTIEINDNTANGPDLNNVDQFGTSIASMGDLNGDGVLDIAVGAIGDDAGGTDRGAIHMMFMNRNALFTLAITNIASNTTTGTLKVGDTITFTLTTNSTDNGITVNGTYNSIPLFWNSADNGTTYTAIYTISEGDTDQSTPLQITNVIITNSIGINTSQPFDGTDVLATIDANSPKFTRAETISTSQIGIILDQNVTNNTASPNDFTLGGVTDGSIGSIAYVSGSAIVLDVTGATISDTDSVTLSYNRTSGSFDEASGNSLLYFAGNVTNNLNDPPIITLNGTNPQTIELGSGYTELGATTNDGSQVTINSDEFRDTVGTYSIYYDSTDTAGNDATQVVRTIIVYDTISPIITLIGANPQTIELGSGYTELGATTSDGSEVTINTANFTDSVGTYSIYYDSTDTAGNDAVQVVRTVNVVDTTPPVITLNGTNPQTIELGSGYTELGATTSDGSEVTINTANFTDSVGTYSIYYDSTDTAGNDATQVVRTIIVYDTISPIITLNGTNPQTIELGSGYTELGATTSDGSEVTINTANFTDSVGTYSIYYDSTDTAGNDAVQVVRTVNVVDTTPPVITLNGTNPQTIELGSGYTELGATTSDGSEVTINTANFTDSVDTYSIYYDSTDTAGNDAVQVVRTVNVVDTTPPVITLNGTNPQTIELGSGYTELGATTNDGSQVTINSDEFRDTVGTYSIYYDSTDTAGNNATQVVRTVNVVDATPPVITNITSNTTTGTLKVGDTITFTLAIDSAENDATINGTYNSVPLFWNSANNGTTYTAIYTVSEGDTDQSTPLQITNVIITNSIGINTSQPFDGTDVLVTIDANSPKFTRAETISTSQIGIILDQNVTNNTASPNDFTLGGVTDGSIGSIAYVSGSAIVLDVTGATISDTDSVTISYNRTSGSFDEASGNSLLYFAENVTNTLDTTPLVITNITSNTTTGTLKVGDTITFTLAIDSAENDATINGTYNSVPLFWNSANNGTTYTAIYTISEGDTDQSTPLQITNVIITNSIGINTSQPFDGTDVLVTIDANSPKFTRAETISTSQIGIILDQNVTNNTASPNDFTLGGVTDGSIGSIAYVSGSAIVLDVTGATISDTDSVTISYNRTSGSFDEASGNSLLYFAENVTNTLDTTPLVITNITSNTTTGTLKVGDTITFTLAIDSAENDATINGTYNSVPLFWNSANNGTTYTAIYTISEGDTDQSTPLQITNVIITNSIGINTSQPFDGTDVLVTIDANSPKFTRAETISTSQIGIILDQNVTNNTASPNDFTLGGVTDGSIGSIAYVSGSAIVLDVTGATISDTDSVTISYNRTSGSFDEASGNSLLYFAENVTNTLDTTPPVITLNGANPQTIELGSGYTELGATTSDDSEVTINSDEFRDIVGTYSIYYDSTDTAGNSATQVIRTVNVVDTTSPVITLNGVNPQTIELGNGYTELGATTNDGSQVIINTTNFTDSVGTYSIYYDSMDASGNDATQVIRIVNVVDTTPPVITLSGANPQTIELGSGYTELGVTTSDGSQVIINTTNFTDSVGTYSIYYDSMDASGNNATQVIRTVNVVDTTSPIITLNGTNPQTIELGSGYTELGVTTDDGSEVTINSDEFRDIVGTYSIYYDSTDTAGNNATQVNRTVNVVDTIPPVITLNGTNPQTIEFGDGYAELGATTSDGSSVTINATEFTDEIGSYSIYYDSTDTAGNNATQVNRTVNVVDTTPPIIILSGPNPQIIEFGDGYAELGATTSDGSQVIINTANFTDSVGTYSIYYDSMDASGNNATQVIRTVNVVDTTSPIITLNGTNPQIIEFGDGYAELGATTSDGSQVIINTANFTDSVGTYSIYYDSTDTAGNNATQVNRTVNVVDTTPPIIILSGPNPQIIEFGDGYAELGAITNDGSQVTIDTANFTDSVGTYSIYYDSMDASGNNAIQVNRTVNVVDTTPPVITLNGVNPQTIELGSGYTELGVTTDDGSQVTINSDEFRDTVGTYSIYYDSTDTAGNDATQVIRTVNVVDTTSPIITLNGTNPQIIEFGDGYAELGATTSDGSQVIINTANFTDSVGTYSIYYDSMDASGNNAIQVNRTVNVVDTTPPVITLNGVNPQTIELGSGYTELGAITNDGSQVTINSDEFRDIVGTYSIYYDSTDTAGNDATQVIRAVNVVDTTPPVITLNGVNPQIIELGSGYTELGVTTDDGSQVTINSDEFRDIVGTYSIYYDSTDTAGNDATQVIRTVNVVDTTSPIITLNGTNPQIIEFGDGYAELGAITNDGSQVTINTANFTDSVGTYSIYYDSMDASGNNAIQVNRTVNVVDTTPPVITLNGVNPQTIELGSGYTELGAITNDGSQVTINSDEFRDIVGTYSIYYDSTDTAGNDATQVIRTVNVVDTTSPIITLNGTNPQIIEFGDGYAELGAITNDGSQVTIDTANFTDSVGTYSIYYDSMDASGNNAIQVNRTVNVVDTTPPVITLNGTNPQTIELGSGYTELGAITNDGSQVTINSDEFRDIVDTYSIYYDSTDTVGNDAIQVIRTVNVVDTTSPVITNITSNTTTGTLKVGDTITFTLTIYSAENDATINGTYNSVPLFWNSTDNGTTYTADYTVSEGDMDQTAPLQITDVTITDDSNNTSMPFDGTDIQSTIDANSPKFSRAQTITTLQIGVVLDQGVTYNVASPNDFTLGGVDGGSIGSIAYILGSAIVLDVTGATISDTDSVTISYNRTFGSFDEPSGNSLLNFAENVTNTLDTTPPVITLNGANPQTIELGSGYTELGAITNDGSQVTINSDEFRDIVGTYSIYYDSTDTVGNDAIQVIRTVNVVDTTPPVITNITSNTTTGTLKVGDTITFTLTIDSAENDATINGTYNSVPLFWNSTNNGTTYTAIYTVSEGETDQTAPLQITDVTITDSMGSTSLPFDGTDIQSTIDANSPKFSRAQTITTLQIGVVLDQGVTYNVASPNDFTLGGVDGGSIGSIAYILGSAIVLDVTGATISDTDSVTISYNRTFGSFDEPSGNSLLNFAENVTNTLDTTPPVITLNGANPQTIELGSGYTELGAITNDGSQVTINSDEFRDIVDTYSIYYDSTDTVGNDAIQVIRTVNVIVITPPVSCTPPASGDWTVRESCTINSNTTVQGNVIVQNGSVLTIPSGVTVDIDFVSFNLTVQSGSGVFIESGGTVT